MSDTKLVAILNVTPDSFSDGGRALDAGSATAAIEQFIEDGAEIIDIGAESTRPGATPVPPDEEWVRLSPVMEALPRFASRVIFSIDTRHAKTATRALDAGVQWVNDVTGFASPDMVAAVRDAKCNLVFMHSLTVPADPSIVLPATVDPIMELLSFAEMRMDSLANAGVAPSRLIFDPGIGFGKTVGQSKYILEHIAAFHLLGLPLLVGHSRKSFLGVPMESRDSATLVVSQQLAQAGVDYLRVHDIKSHKQMLEMALCA